MARWLDVGVGVLGLLLLAVSFQAWYFITWAYSLPGGGTGTATSTADAWHASSQWTVAVLLGVAAAATSVVVASGAVPAVGRSLVRVLVVVAIVLGFALVVQQWSAMHAPVVRRQVVIVVLPAGARTPPADAIGTIRRDALMSDHENGFDADVDPGFVTGASVLVLELGVAAAALAAGLARR
jgi:hypothetical protein